MKFIDISQEGELDSAYFSLAAEKYFMAHSAEPFCMMWITPPTTVSGSYQNIYAEVNLEYAKKHNIDVVRRYSGGGTIYTDEGGLQFAYFFPKVSSLTFADCCRDVVAALNNLGANAEFNGRNDIYAFGRKICGNAQYSNEYGLLHHGTLLWRTKLEALQEVLTPPDDKISSKGVKSVRAHVRNVAELVGSDMSASQLREYFKEFFGVTVVKITEEERKEINKIRDVMVSDEYIFGKNPAFNYTNKKRFAGGSVCFNASVQKDIIKECSFTGDFFYNGEIEELCSKLVGLHFKSEQAKNVLCENNNFYLVSDEDLISLL